MVPISARHYPPKPSRIPVPKKGSSTLPAYRPSSCCTKGTRSNVARTSCDKPLDPVARSRLQADLEFCFRAWRGEQHRISSKWDWTTAVQIIYRLESPSLPPQTVNYWNIRSFCNKPTALYWATTAQVKGQCPMLTWACIYKQWHRYHDNQPNIDFEHFFATPIQIICTGPQTIAETLGVHKSLCDQVSSFLSAVREGENSHERWLDPQNYKLLSVYRAAFVLLDNYGRDSIRGEPEVFVLDEEIQRQNALIVLTGDDTGLSAPITFDSIKAQSLPIARKDAAIHGNVQVIRVSLLTAVRFIIDLERREEAAFPSPYIATDRTISPPTKNISFGTITATDWADEILQKIDEKGIANVKEAALVPRTNEAGEREDCSEVEFMHFSLRWK